VESNAYGAATKKTAAPTASAMIIPSKATITTAFGAPFRFLPQPGHRAASSAMVEPHDGQNIQRLWFIRKIIILDNKPQGSKFTNQTLPKQ
jgi:hypothetical protein